MTHGETRAYCLTHRWDSSPSLVSKGKTFNKPLYSPGIRELIPVRTYYKDSEQGQVIQFW
jgi:hypothetical protein